MSVAYNRRRGAKANKPRRMRQCRNGVVARQIGSSGAIVSESVTLPFERCIRLADGASRYCADHRFRGPVLPEGPISRRLRLEHQARQQREDALLPRSCRRKRTAKQFGIKDSSALKAMRRRLKQQALLAGFFALFGIGKKAAKSKNPWAK